MMEEQAAALMQLYLDAGHGKAAKRVAELLQKAGHKATATQVTEWRKQYKGKSNAFYRGLLKDTQPLGRDSVRGLMGAKPRAKALADAIDAAERVLRSSVSETAKRKRSRH
jgi:hypothetical protein